MASIYPGFEYDIFISYRHNDNLDGWVTDFVQSLEKELKATVKEPLSIYFDKNPHDGLLETHSVDKSLEGKLKCLIFIPIISQTYCDAKSFAWQHEFCAFNTQAKEDSLGRDIKLANGNVASRILPIKIHDLDEEDKSAIEKEIGGALRAIEFIYKSSGVNRPLTPSDKKEDNGNKTLYKDQLNKTANAVKELVSAIKNPQHPAPAASNSQQTAKPPSSRRKTLLIVLAFLLLAVGYFIYQRQSTGSEQSNTDKSIAVLPFADLSEKKDQEYFSDGLTEELLDLLSRQKELRVIGRTSSFAFKGKNEDLRTIGEKLGVSYILEGSVRRSGTKLRITAQLIKADDGSHLWSETFEREVNDIFSIYDEIASNIVKKLDITFSDLSLVRKSKPEVYDLVLQAKFLSAQPTHILETKELLQRALAMDSTDARIWAGLALYYGARLWQYDSSYLRDSDLALLYAERAVKLDPGLADAHQVMANMLRNRWQWQRALEETKIAIELNPAAFYTMIYMSLGDLPKQLEVCKVAVNSDPLSAGNWRNLAATYFFMGKFDESIKAVNQALKLLPDYQEVHNWKGRSYMSQGKYDEALKEFRLMGRDSLQQPAVLYALKGDIQKSDSYIKRIDRRIGLMGAYARIYAARGETDKAFAYLDSAYQRKSPFFIQFKVEPYYNELRKEPRYTALLKKLNLPLD